MLTRLVAGFKMTWLAAYGATSAPAALADAAYFDGLRKRVRQTTTVTKLGKRG